MVSETSRGLRHQGLPYMIALCVVRPALRSLGCLRFVHLADGDLSGNVLGDRLRMFSSSVLHRFGIGGGERLTDV